MERNVSRNHCQTARRSRRHGVILSHCAGPARQRADLAQRGLRVVDPLDLLAALVVESESRAAELLAEFGVETEGLKRGIAPEVWEAFERAGQDVLHAQELAPEGSLPPSESLRLVLSEAAMLARGLDRKREVGTEHLLCGLLSASGPAAELLRGSRLGARGLASPSVAGPRGRVGSAPPGRSDPSAGADRAGRRRRPGANPRRVGQPRARGAASRRRLRPLRARRSEDSRAGSRRCGTDSPRPSAGSMPSSCSARATPAKTSARTS